MKVLLLFLLPVLANAQVPKDANTIIIKGISLQAISTALLDSGYTIEKWDKELQTIRTEPIRYKRYWNGAYKMNIRVKDSIAYFTGIYQCPYQAQTTSPLSGVPSQPRNWDNSKRIAYQTNHRGEAHFKGMLCHPFLLMNEFVKSFGKEVTYIKQ